MKKLVFVVAFAFLGTSLLAGNGKTDFVATSEGTFFFDNVRYGIQSYLVGKKSNGEKVKFSKEEVLSFTKNDQYFEKMPKIVDNKPIDEKVMMELMKAENGMRFFRYDTYDVNGNKISNFYIYKNRDYVVQIDERNVEHLKNFLN